MNAQQYSVYTSPYVRVIATVEPDLSTEVLDLEADRADSFGVVFYQVEHRDATSADGWSTVVEYGAPLADADLRTEAARAALGDAKASEATGKASAPRGPSAEGLRRVIEHHNTVCHSIADLGRGSLRCEAKATRTVHRWGLDLRLCATCAEDLEADRVPARMADPLVDLYQRGRW